MIRRAKLSEWSRLGPEDGGGDDLRGARLDDVSARETAKRLAKENVIEVQERLDGLHVRAFAHVGRITLGSLEITVAPKIGASELLELFRYAYALRQLRRLDGSDFGTGTLFQDLIAQQLLDEVADLVDRGLVKKYVARADLLGSPRGRIDLDALARRGPLVDTELACRHHVRSVENPLNAVLLAGVKHASAIAQDASLRRSLLRLAARVGNEVRAVPLTARAVQDARGRLDRLAFAYEPSIELIELLLACSAIALDDDTTVSLRGFMFDMNRFFQALVTRFLSDHLEGMTVEAEHALTEIMRYMPGLNPLGAKAPRPRPDLAIRQGRGQPITAFLDAKYRDLWETKLPREMLYQLAIYALAQGKGATSAIVYPTMSSASRESRVEIRDPLGQGALGYVSLRPLVIPRLLEGLRRGHDGDLRALALALVPSGWTSTRPRSTAQAGRGSTHVLE